MVGGVFFATNPVDSNNHFNSAGQCWQLLPEFGEGFYWVYAKKDLYDIKIHDFYFHEDFFMEFHLPEALSITQYESISGEELNPYRRMSAGCINLPESCKWADIVPRILFLQIILIVCRHDFDTNRPQTSRLWQSCSMR